MATYTRNNKTISGNSGSTDYHQGTSVADSISITNITVVSGGPVTVNDDWGLYTVNGGALMYDGEEGNDTLTARNVKIEDGMFQLIGDKQNDHLSASNIIQNAGRFGLNGGWYNDSVSVSNVSVSGYTSNTYTKEGFYISSGGNKNTVSVLNLTLDGAGRFYVEDGTSGGGKTSLKDITFSGNSTTSLRAKGDTVSLDGVNFEKSGYISLSGNGNISAQNITNTVGGGISMTGGENSADEISLEKVTISSGNISINGKGGNDTVSFFI